jgi:hypothetical protein
MSTVFFYGMLPKSQSLLTIVLYPLTLHLSTFFSLSKFVEADSATLMCDFGRNSVGPKEHILQIMDLSGLEEFEIMRVLYRVLGVLNFSRVCATGYSSRSSGREEQY